MKTRYYYKGLTYRVIREVVTEIGVAEFSVIDSNVTYDKACAVMLDSFNDDYDTSYSSLDCVCKFNPLVAFMFSDGAYGYKCLKDNSCVYMAREYFNKEEVKYV